MSSLSDVVHQECLSSVDGSILASFPFLFCLLLLLLFLTKSLCVFIYFIEIFIAVAGKLSGLVFKIFL